jgi:mono/diheme cytochrome c family protein
MTRFPQPRHRGTQLLAAAIVMAAVVGTLPAASTVEARVLEQGHKQPKRRPATASRQQPDGKKVFATTCAACHQPNGEGVEAKYPPLAGSEWATGDEARLIRIVLDGLTGPVEVAGESYSGVMPPWGATLKDPEIAAVATYVRSAWGNKAAPVTTARVAAIRAATKTRTAPWTAPELASIPAGKD